MSGTRADQDLVGRRRAGTGARAPTLHGAGAAMVAAAVVCLLAAPAGATRVDRDRDRDRDDHPKIGANHAEPQGGLSARSAHARLEAIALGVAVEKPEAKAPGHPESALLASGGGEVWLPQGAAAAAPGLAIAAREVPARTVGGTPPDDRGGAPIPEPSALLLFASGAALARRRLGGRVARATPAPERPALRVVSQPDAPPAPPAATPDAEAFSTLPLHGGALAAKRCIDVVGAVLGLMAAAPLLAIAALAIRLDSRGPALFRQVRCGRHGRPFAMWKLRTMHLDAQERKASLLHRNAMDGPAFKVWDDPRVTRVGRYLRRFSLDEVPQLWNVLRGDMSLVGPRPPLEEEVARYSEYERLRLLVKPGLTCEWQVSGRNLIGFKQWVELDLDYIRGWSLRRDLLLIAKTVPAVVRGTGAA